MIAPPGATMRELACLANARSATVTSRIVVMNSTLLFAGAGSVVDADTVARFTMEPCKAVSPTLKVAMMVRT